MVSNLMKRVLAGLFLVAGTNLIGTTYNIGDIAQGGVVFWVRPDQQHGLVVAIEDQNGGNPIVWGTDGPGFSTVGATGNDLSFATSSTLGSPFTTTGHINSNLIVANYTILSVDPTTYAAGLCANLNDGSYDDWYLPSLVELGILSCVLSIVNPILTGIDGGGAVLSAPYWSSFESSTGYAWYQDFSQASQNYVAKDQPNYVRAVRAF